MAAMICLADCRMDSVHRGRAPFHTTPRPPSISPSISSPTPSQPPLPLLHTPKRGRQLSCSWVTLPFRGPRRFLLSHTKHTQPTKHARPCLPPPPIARPRGSQHTMQHRGSTGAALGLRGGANVPYSKTSSPQHYSSSSCSSAAPAIIRCCRPPIRDQPRRRGRVGGSLAWRLGSVRVSRVTLTETTQKAHSSRSRTPIECSYKPSHTPS